MRKILLIMLLAIFLIFSADARLPQKGDKVRINAAGIIYFGNITDIGEGLICLNCTDPFSPPEISDGHYDGHCRPMATHLPRDVCLGIGSIISLIWLDQCDSSFYMEPNLQY
jgi:hypothetical protein